MTNLECVSTSFRELLFDETVYEPTCNYICNRLARVYLDTLKLPVPMDLINFKTSLRSASYYAYIGGCHVDDVEFYLDCLCGEGTYKCAAMHGILLFDIQEGGILTRVP